MPAHKSNKKQEIRQEENRLVALLQPINMARTSTEDSCAPPQCKATPEHKVKMNSIEQDAALLASSKSFSKRFSLRCVLSPSNTKRGISGLTPTPPDSPCSSVSSADNNSSIQTTWQGGRLPIRSILKSSQTSSFNDKESIGHSKSSFFADATNIEPKRRRLFRGESRQLHSHSHSQNMQDKQKSVHWQDESKWMMVPACACDYRNVMDTDLWWSTKDFQTRKAQEVALVRRHRDYSFVPDAYSVEDHHPPTPITAVDYLRVCQNIYHSMLTEFQREEAEQIECIWTRRDFHLHYIRNSPNFSAGLLSGYRGMENGGFSNRRPLAKMFVKTIVEAHRDWLNHDEMTVAELAARKSRTDRYWALFMAQGDAEEVVYYHC